MQSKDIYNSSFFLLLFFPFSARVWNSVTSFMRASISDLQTAIYFCKFYLSEDQTWNYIRVITILAMKPMDHNPSLWTCGKLSETCNGQTFVDFAKKLLLHIFTLSCLIRKPTHCNQLLVYWFITSLKMIISTVGGHVNVYQF